MIKRFRKKPVVVEAMKWDGKDKTFIELQTFTDYQIENPEGNTIYIPTLEGDMLIGLGDWVIKGINGEFYPCKPDIFEATHEEVIQDEDKRNIE